MDGARSWVGEQQIPYGNDRKKSKSKCNRGSFASLRRFPPGMTDKKSKGKKSKGKVRVLSADS